MTAGREDDALSWEGDDDPTLETRGNDRSRPLPEGFTPVGKGSEAFRPQPSRSAGNAALIGLGVIGGVYLLYALGWLLGGLRLLGVAPYLVSQDGQGPPLWSAGNAVALALAVAAPAIWFATVFVLTRGSAPWLRWVLLGAGVVLLVPWPFVMVGVIG